MVLVLAAPVHAEDAGADGGGLASGGLDAGVAVIEGNGDGPEEDGEAAGAELTPLAWREARSKTLADEVQELVRATEALVALGDANPVLPEALATRAGSDAATPADAATLELRLEKTRQVLENQLRDEEALAELAALRWGDSKRPIERARAAAARLTAERTAAELNWQLALARWLEATALAREAAAVDPLQRQIDSERAAAAAAEREAERAAAAAAAERRDARSEIEQLLASERAALQKVDSAQARYRALLVEEKAKLARITADIGALDDALAELEPVDGYERLIARLERRRVAALEDNLTLLTGVQPPARPPEQLGAEVRGLPKAYAEVVAELESLRARLAKTGQILTYETRSVINERADVLYRRMLDLNDRRIELFPRLPERFQERVFGISKEGGEALRGEAVQLAGEATYWLHTRADQVTGRRLEWRSVIDLIWWLLETLILLALLRFAMRHWDEWMSAGVVAIGRYMPLGDWSLFWARFVDSAKSFGPPLLVALAAIGVRALMGGVEAPVELQITYRIVFWLAIMRFQLRVILRLAHYAQLRARERQRERQDQVEAEDAAETHTTLPATAAVIAPAPLGDAPPGAMVAKSAATLFAYTWRVLTLYVSIIVIVLALTRYGIGRGVIYYWLTVLAWWGALPLSVHLLRLWRPRIVQEYVRWSPNAGRLTIWAKRHSDHFYGVFILAAVFLVVLARKFARFGRNNLSNLDATKRLLAFLFRRRVEKHAQEHGRVLEKPHELPPELTAAFPTGALQPIDRPVRPGFLDELAAALRAWTEDQADGSVAVVGASGMGKTTALTLFAREIETPVVYGKLRNKLTEPSAMVAQIAALIGFEETPSSEEQLVSLLRVGDRRVIIVDNCHNLFLRQVGGFDAWEAFTRVVNETCDHVFWVLSFNATAWRYLNNMSGRVSYFRRVIEMPPWTDDALRRLILGRMRRAGFKPNFTDLLVTRLEGVKTSTQIIRTSQGYFRLLWDFTNGNPRLATHFWLRSLVPEEDRKMRVNLFAAPRVEELERLPDDIAFALQAVVEHENINAAELAQSLSLGIDFCRFALRFGRERGYLWRNPVTGRTHVSIHWQGSIQRYLKRKGLLYS